MPGLVPGIHVFKLVASKDVDGRDIRYNGALRALARPGRLTLWIKPGLGPWLARRRAAKFEAAVQAKRPVVPEFEFCGDDPPAAPSLRALAFPAAELRADLAHRLFA